MRIAVVGAGVTGLVCARLLSRRNDVTVFEADDRPGGHANTVRVDLPDGSFDVDTGFLVFNERNYPGFVALLADLGVATRPSEMSFGVRDEVSGIEWRGTSFDTVFAQRRNLVRPAFLRMLAEIVRFDRTVHSLLDGRTDATVTLADLLDRGRWSSPFVDWYLVPTGCAVWSADPSTFLDMPAVTFARFLTNHGLIGFGNRLDWRTVDGGSRRYVDAIVADLGRSLHLGEPVTRIVRGPDGVEVHSARGPGRFDQVVVATHGDQALALLSDPSPVEREVLGAFRFQPNRATLHTDVRLLPTSRRAWASWNYHRTADRPDAATLTYRLRSLQGITSKDELLVTLNRDDVIDPATVLRSFDYAHPVFDAAAVAAQARREELDGHNRTWFAGSYWGDGFHEDGVESARAVCRRLAGEDL